MRPAGIAAASLAALGIATFLSVAAPGPVFAGASTLPTPTLVEHPSGWYQLRGDGVTTSYSWVWIPKPPAPPTS